MRLAFAIALTLAGIALSSRAADVEAGRKLVQQKGCDGCHQRKTMGDASAIYTRKDRHVNTASQLKAQVALCNSELNLGLFPDEEEQVAEYLDATYYRFGSTAK